MLGHQLLRCGPWLQQGRWRSLLVPMAAAPKAEDIDFDRTSATELETMNVTEIKKLCKMHGLSAVGESSGRWNLCPRWVIQASKVDADRACTPDGRYSGVRLTQNRWLCRCWQARCLHILLLDQLQRVLPGAGSSICA